MDSSGGARSKKEIAIMNSTRRVRLILVFAGLLIIPVGGGWLPASPAPPAKGLEASFRNMAVVVKVTVDYKAGQAVVTFDTNKQSAESLSKFVASCGYKVTETK